MNTMEMGSLVAKTKMLPPPALSEIFTIVLVMICEVKNGKQK